MRTAMNGFRIPIPVVEKKTSIGMYSIPMDSHTNVRPDGEIHHGER